MISTAVDAEYFSIGLDVIRNQRLYLICKKKKKKVTCDEYLVVFLLSN